MRTPCVALAMRTRLDVHTVRELYDFGELDEADAVRAYEHTRAQRGLDPAPPAYLRALASVAAVFDDGDAIRLAAFDARSGEGAALSGVFESWPGDDGRLVCWDASEGELLAVRAFVHGLVCPDGVTQWPRLGLRACLANDAHGSEEELMRALGLPAAGGDDDREDALGDAVNRYRCWLRWQYSRGRIGAAERAECEAEIERFRPPSRSCFRPRVEA